MKHKLAETVAFFLFIIGIIVMGALTGAMFAEIIKGWTYLFWMAVVAGIMYLDVVWISRHFVNGEWV